MSDEQDKLKVSLEPPKLFGRKKKAGAPAAKASSAPADEPTDDTAVIEAATEVPGDDTAVIDTAPEVPGDHTSGIDVPSDDVSEPAAAPKTAKKAAKKAAAKTAPKAAAATTAAEPAVASTATSASEPTTKRATKSTAKPAAESTPATTSKSATTPATKPVAAAAPAATTTTEPDAAPQPSAATKKSVRPRAKLAPPIEPEPVTDTDLEDAAIVSAADDDGPLLDLYPAAAVTGVVVGAVMVLLTWLSLRGCEAVRGTSSCGGGPGFLLLVATFVLCILLGSTLLKTFQIPDPGSSSFLAVGLVAVIALLFLIDALDHWSMLIVIPLLSVGAYLASVWVTKTFVEPTDLDAV